MAELNRQGYIELPPDLARATGFSRWDPRNQAQTSRVIVEMSKGSDGEKMQAATGKDNNKKEKQ